MDVVESTLVQIQEIGRLLEKRSPAHVRLAYLLLDHAAELVMYRAVEADLYYMSADRKRIESYERALESPTLTATQASALRAMADELRTHTLSKSKARDVEREFGARVDYLVSQGSIEPGMGRALKRLHVYRNEIYHRDEIRSETIGSATTLDAHLVSRLIRDLPPHSMQLVAKYPPNVVEAIGDVAWAPDRALARIAELLERTAPVTTSIPAALAQHLTNRLKELRETVEFIAGTLAEFGGPIESFDDALRFLQLPDDQAFIDRTALRAGNPSVTEATIDRWEARASNLETHEDGITAFGAFADLEEELEPIESSANEMATQIDAEIQLQIDIARGK